jgi:hypothetical protein
MRHVSGDNLYQCLVAERGTRAVNQRSQYPLYVRRKGNEQNWEEVVRSGDGRIPRDMVRIRKEVDAQ